MNNRKPHGSNALGAPLLALVSAVIKYIDDADARAGQAAGSDNRKGM